jgi:FAD/FMN-containing dehydrogenase
MMEALLADGIEAGLVEDAVIAASEEQRRALWHMRESMSPAQKPEGGSIKHDVSVPVSAIPAFMAEADAAVMKAIRARASAPSATWATATSTTTSRSPSGADRRPSSPAGARSTTSVHAIVLSYFGGSISAEHGIGQLKRDELIAAARAPIEMDLMRQGSSTPSTPPAS